MPQQPEESLFRPTPRLAGSFVAQDCLGSVNWNGDRALLGSVAIEDGGPDELAWPADEPRSRPDASSSAEPPTLAGTDPNNERPIISSTEVRDPIHVGTISMVETRWTVEECPAGYERLLTLLFRPQLQEHSASSMGAREESEVA